MMVSQKQNNLETLNTLPDIKLLEVVQYDDIGYRPLVDFNGWRVAVLNYIDELLPQNLIDMQRHDETDEVFVLLKGHCILFLGDNSENEAATGEITTHSDHRPGRIHAVDMQPYKFYVVKQGSWHTHTLSHDAMLLIVENTDTTSENSPRSPLDPDQRALIVKLTNTLWNASLFT
jgi:mannose-6-phosphate isomerase-like protein (cupin superfamily)